MMGGHARVDTWLIRGRSAGGFENSTESRLRRVVAGQAVHPAARRRRGRADEYRRVRRGVRVEADGGTGPQLPQVLQAAGDVAAHVVGVVGLEVGRSHGGAANDPRADAWRVP